MPLWFLGPVGACVGFAIGFAYEQRGERKKRAPWARLLETDAIHAVRSGGVGVLDGVAADGNGQIAPLVAPFTGRQCLAFHIEIVSRERSPGPQHETITWTRVFEDARGQALVTSGGQLVGRVVLDGASVLFPPDLSAGHVGGVSVYASSSSAFDSSQVPQHLAAFAAQVGLQGARKDSLFTAGRNLTFNERIIVPGQPLAAAGSCIADPAGAGILLASSDVSPVFFASEPVSRLRERATKIPVGKLIGSGVVGAITFGILVTMLVAMTASFTERSQPTPGAPSSQPAGEGSRRPQ